LLDVKAGFENSIEETLRARLARKGRLSSCEGMVKTLLKAASDMRVVAAILELTYKHKLETDLSKVARLLERNAKRLRKAYKNIEVCSQPRGST